MWNVGDSHISRREEQGFPFCKCCQRCFSTDGIDDEEIEAPSGVRESVYQSLDRVVAMTLWGIFRVRMKHTRAIFQWDEAHSGQGPSV